MKAQKIKTIKGLLFMTGPLGLASRPSVIYTGQFSIVDIINKLSIALIILS
jgi:hypothetical protein